LRGFFWIYKFVLTHYIQKLIERGENQQLDFKFEISDSRKIAKTLVAFANTDGGKLLVGVKDNGRIAGVRSDEEFHMVEAAAQMYCRPTIDFLTKEWAIEGKTVLEVIIPKLDQSIHYAQNTDEKWLAYLRVDDQNLRANKIMLRVWKGRNSKRGVKISYSDAEKFLLHYLKANESISFSQFVKLGNLSRNRAETVLVNFILLKIIDIVFTEKLIYYKLSKRNED
jgi:predicted HTH transcriptional regulator